MKVKTDVKAGGGLLSIDLDLDLEIDIFGGKCGKGHDCRKYCK